MDDRAEQGFKLFADVGLFSENQVLLIKYKDPEDYDGQSGWFLPDSSIKYLEHPAKAAERFLRDQLDLQYIPLDLDHIESFRGNDGTWHLSFHYRANIRHAKVSAAKQIGKAEWFPLTALPAKDEVAHHGWSLNTLKKMMHPQEG